MKWWSLLVVSLVCLVGCEESEHSQRITDLQSLNQPSRVVGVPQGAASMAVAEKTFHNATIRYYIMTPDGYTAVEHKKIDAFVFSRDNMRYATEANANLALLDEGLEPVDIVVGIGKHQPSSLTDEINAFIAQSKADGTLREMEERWLVKKDLRSVEVPKATAPTRHFVVATEGLCEPFTFFAEGGQLIGFDVEFAQRLAVALNASIEFVSGDFAGMIAGVQSGKVDLLISNLNVTPERSEQMQMSQPYMTTDVAVLVHKDNLAPAGITHIQQMEGKRGATPIGTAYPELTEPYVQGIEWSTFNDFPSCLQALMAGKVDGAFADEPVALLSVAKYPTKLQIAHVYADDSYGFAFRKGSPLPAKVTEVIRRLRASGELDALKQKWCLGPAEGKVLQTYPEGERKGTLVYATDPTLEPMVYIGKGGEVVGLEIDILHRVAYELGLTLEIVQTNFGSLIDSLVAERVDMVGAAMSITKERQQRVDFSESHYKGGLTLITGVTNASNDQVPSLWTSFKESFERTFVREARWKLILEGLEVTLLITVCAAILGTILAFGVCALRRSTRPSIATIGKVYIAVVQGTPILVILMIFYYILFATWDVDAIWIAILGFALNFAAYVGEMFRSGLEGIPRGQSEAAAALGFTRFAAFRKVLFPQVLLRILPIYRGEFINMLKTTSIVGYIAIQDLTKMSDIIRSRTYEAFFPLIATAVIYFVVAHLLATLLVAVEGRLNPLNRRLKQKRLATQKGGAQ